MDRHGPGPRAEAIPDSTGLTAALDGMGTGVATLIDALYNTHYTDAETISLTTNTRELIRLRFGNWFTTVLESSKPPQPSLTTLFVRTPESNHVEFTAGGRSRAGDLWLSRSERTGHIVTRTSWRSAALISKTKYMAVMRPNRLAWRFGRS